MGIMTEGALLRSGVILDHDLGLLQRSPRHLFVTKRAERPRVGRDGKLQVVGVNRAGRCVDIALLGVAAAAGAVADLAFHDLADIGAVVDAFGPFGELRGVAGLAICRALVLGFVAGDFRHRVAAIVPVLVKGLVDEKISRRDRDDAKRHDEKDEPHDMLGHVSAILFLNKARPISRWH